MCVCQFCGTGINNHLRGRAGPGPGKQVRGPAAVRFEFFGIRRVMLLKMNDSRIGEACPPIVV